MAQSSEQALFSTGNTTGTRERQIALGSQQSAQTLKEYVRPFADGTATDAYVLTARDWGKTLLIPVIDAGINLTLTVPAPSTASGASFCVFLDGTSTATGDLIFSMGGTSLTAGSLRAKYPNTVIDTAVTDDFTLTGAQLGSYVQCFSNGSYWFVSGSVQYVTAYDDVVDVTIATADYTVLESNSGKTHLISAGHATFAIVLPAVADCAGSKFKFVLGASLAAICTIRSLTDDVIDGTLVHHTTIAHLTFTNQKDVIFASGDDAGCWMEFISDGAAYICSGYSNGIVTTATA